MRDPRPSSAQYARWSQSSTLSKSLKVNPRLAPHEVSIGASIPTFAQMALIADSMRFCKEMENWSACVTSTVSKGTPTRSASLLMLEIMRFCSEYLNLSESDPFHVLNVKNGAVSVMPYLL